MKKLRKLCITPEKIMKNEELMTLRGGYGAGTCGWDGNGGQFPAYCGFSKDLVILWANIYCGHWCCDTPTDYCLACG